MFLKKPNICFCWLLCCIFMITCKTQDKTYETVLNPHLKNLPEIALQYAKQYQLKKDSLDNCLDINSGWRLEEELKQIRTQWNRKIELETQNLDDFTSLPFQQSVWSGINLNEIRIEKERVSRNHIGIVFVFSPASSATHHDLSDYDIYFYGQDQKERLIPGTLNFTTGVDREEDKSGLVKIRGLLGPLENLNDFNRVAIISKDEYLKICEH